MSRAASHLLSMASRSGAIGLQSRAPPSHLANRILASATDVIEEVSSATVRTCPSQLSLELELELEIEMSGALLTNRIDRTARRAAMATSGMITRSGTVV